MKVSIVTSGGLSGLKRRFEREGAQLCHSDEAELVLWDKGGTCQVSPTKVRQLGLKFPQLVLKKFGFTLTEGLPKFCVTRWFGNGEWKPQCYVSVPLVGLMDRNMGPQCASGCGGRYMPPSIFDHLFENELLKLTLEQMQFEGLLTLGLTERGVCQMETGVPYYGLYAILEGVKQPLVEFFTNPSRVMESWSVALLLSRAPYPYHESGSTVRADGLCPEVEKHFWSFIQGGSSSLTRVGVATAWSPQLSAAGTRVLQTCGRIQVPEKQYRTDLVQRVKEVWPMVEGMF